MRLNENIPGIKEGVFPFRMLFESTPEDINKLLKEKEKNQLDEFLLLVSKTGMENAKNSLSSSYYYKKYLSQLAYLNINPILIPKNRKDFPSFMANPFIP